MNSEVTPTPATSFVLPIDLFYFKMFSPLNAVSLRLPLPCFDLAILTYIKTVTDNGYCRSGDRCDRGP